jgi:ABC-2 type transport system ATP-binding protein
MKKIIEIKNLEKNFRKKNVLKKINLDVHFGEKIAIMGPNGAGKTTILEILLNIIPLTKGSVKVNIPFNKIGMQFQDANFPSGITSQDIIKFFNEINAFKISDEELKKQMNFFQISSFADTNSKSLSGGQKQKLNLILSLIHDPELIILDEITTGLDFTSKNLIVNYIKEKTKGKDKTLIIISHNLDEVKKLVDRLIYLKDGKIVFDKELKRFNSKNSIEKELEKLI